MRVDSDRGTETVTVETLLELILLRQHDLDQSISVKLW